MACLRSVSSRRFTILRTLRRAREQKAVIMWRKLAGPSLSVLLLGSVGNAQTPTSGQPAPAAQHAKSQTTQGPSPVFREIEPIIRRNSRVPLRLPEYLPFEDTNNPIYAITESIDSSSYKIMLAWAPNCTGANWCLYGSVRGSNLPFEPVDGKKALVTLHGGIKAEFFESTCYTYCSQAYIRWSEGGFYYSIGMKAGRKTILTRAANSAIATSQSE
jgi:hypothetical protein